MKYILLGFGILLFSCHSGKLEKDNGNSNSNTVDISIDTWIIENPQLKSELSDYIIKVEDEIKDGNFIEINYKAINDSTCRFVFWVSLDNNIFTYHIPHVLFKFEQQLVSLHIEGLDIFKINNDFILEYLKKNDPDQYDYYLQYGDYPISPTGGGLQWELVFQNDSLISKEEYFTQ